MLDHLFPSRLRLALLVPAALLVMGIAAACGGGGDDSDDDTNGNGDGHAPSADPVTIVMKDNVYEPADITIPVNAEVEITVENTGAAVHNMRVMSKAKEGKDFTSELLVNPGKSSTFTVKLTKKGEYDFQCDYHLPAMAGKIKVQ